MKLLDKVSQDYNKRQKKLETPGWLFALIGLVLLILGLFVDNKISRAIGLLSLALGTFLIILGRVLHQTFRK